MHKYIAYILILLQWNTFTFYVNCINIVAWWLLMIMHYMSFEIVCSDCWRLFNAKNCRQHKRQKIESGSGASRGWKKVKEKQGDRESNVRGVADCAQLVVYHKLIPPSAFRSPKISSSPTIGVVIRCYSAVHCQCNYRIISKYQWVRLTNVVNVAHPQRVRTLTYTRTLLRWCVHKDEHGMNAMQFLAQSIHCSPAAMSLAWQTFPQMIFYSLVVWHFSAYAPNTNFSW